MPDVIERQKEQDKFPVQNTHENKETDECGNFENSPICIRPALSFNFGKNRFRIVTQIAQKDIAPDGLGLAVVAMPINRQPIDGLTLFVRFIAIPHVMPMMHIFVKCLGEPKSKRFAHWEYPIQRMPAKIRVVYEIVRDPV